MTQAPAGFRDVQTEEPTGVRIDKDALKSGVVVQFRGTRRFVRANDGGTTVVQIFLARGGKGKRFSVFGTAQLDSKLKSVKIGSIIWLLYSGKKLVDGQETHVWHVSDAGNRVEPDKLEELTRNSAKEHDALDGAITIAERERSIKSSTEPDIGQYDEPLPF